MKTRGFNLLEIFPTRILLFIGSFLFAGTSHGTKIMWLKIAPIFTYNDVFTHQIIQIPKNGDCQATASEVAERFARETGTEIYRAVGQASIVSERVPDPLISGHFKVVSQPSKIACDVEFAYVGKPVSVFSIPDQYQYYGPSYHQFTLPVEYGFSQLSECTAALTDRVALFRKHTGIDPFVAHCYSRRIDVNTGQKMFMEHIQGIGVSRTGHFKWVIPWVQETTLDWIQKEIASLGGDIVKVVSFRADGGGNSLLMLLFYAPRFPGLRLHFHTPTRFDTSMECEQTKADLRDIHTSAGNLVLESRCESHPSALIPYFSLHGVTHERTSLSVGEPPLSKYQSSEQCRADRLSALQFLAKQNPENKYFGAICEYSDAHWRMLAYWARVASP